MNYAHQKFYYVLFSLIEHISQDEYISLEGTFMKLVNPQDVPTIDSKQSIHCLQKVLGDDGFPYLIYFGCTVQYVGD